MQRNYAVCDISEKSFTWHYTYSPDYSLGAARDPPSQKTHQFSVRLTRVENRKKCVIEITNETARISTPIRSEYGVTRTNSFINVARHTVIFEVMILADDKIKYNFNEKPRVKIACAYVAPRKRSIAINSFYLNNVNNIIILLEFLIEKIILAAFDLSGLKLMVKELYQMK